MFYFELIKKINNMFDVLTLTKLLLHGAHRLTSLEEYLLAQNAFYKSHDLLLISYHPEG